MGLKLCCVAWDSWGFVKKDKDRAPVIQSCVYTEIHNILTWTSLWRWQRHALIWNFLCCIILGVDAISCFVFVYFFFFFSTFFFNLLRHHSRLIRQFTFLYFGLIMCGMTFWWVIITPTYILATMRLLTKTSLFLFSQSIKRQNKSFLTITWSGKVPYVTDGSCIWKPLYPHNSTSLPAPSPASFLSMRIVGVDGIKRFRLPFHFFSSVTFDHFTACFLIDPCHHALALRLTWLLCLHSSFKLETIFAVAATSTCSLSFPTLSSLCQCGCCLSGLSGEVIKWFCSLL